MMSVCSNIKPNQAQDQTRKAPRIAIIRQVIFLFGFFAACDHCCFCSGLFLTLDGCVLNVTVLVALPSFKPDGGIDMTNPKVITVEA